MAMFDFIMQDEDDNDINVQAELKRIPQRAESVLKNLFGNWYVSQDAGVVGGELKVGTIENVALRFGVKTIYTDMAAPTSGDMKQWKKFDHNDPWGSLPELRDDETGESLPTRLLKLLVNMKGNRWLPQHDRFQQVFGPYLDEEYEKKDPTKDTSMNGSTDTSSELESQIVELQTS